MEFSNDNKFSISVHLVYYEIWGLQHWNSHSEEHIFLGRCRVSVCHCLNTNNFTPYFYLLSQKKKKTGGRGVAVLRWWRNRMGRPLSPLQIHQKNIWTLSKFHKTTSECWQRTSGTQKGSPLSSKGGRENIQKIKRETKEGGTEIHPGKGVLKRRGFQTPGNTLTGKSVASLGTSEGNITRRKISN